MSSFRFNRVVALGIAVATILMVGGLSAEAQSAPSSSTSVARVTPDSLRVRAFGDGVTAGFGTGSDGVVIPASKSSECRPKWTGNAVATTAGTRCSSNGSNGPGTPADEVAFSADFGLANGASWAAQVAQQLGSVDYANYSVAGSTLAGWLNLPADEEAPEEGAQHELLKRIQREDPDIVLASIGGEALLQQTSGPVRLCSVWKDSATENQQFVDCVNKLLDRQLVKQRVMAISFDVLAQTRNAKLLLATYAPAVPFYSALLPWQQDILAAAINLQIRAAVEGVKESGASWSERIEAVAFTSSGGEKSSECKVSAVRGPRLWAPSWFLVSSQCRSAGLTTTPVSLGTVPNSERQRGLSIPALELLRAQRWVQVPAR
ncbi:MAG: hypothetical protein WEA11_01655 [Acidimicrobiales bacterium]